MAILIGFFLISLTSSGGLSPQLQRLSARLDALQEMITQSKKSISDPDLSKLSSDLSILTAGSIAQLQTPLKNAGMGSISDDIKKAEADEATLQKLEEAKLAGIFDRTYARLLKLKLDTLLVLMNDIYDETKSGALKNALSGVYKDFGTIRKQLDEDINV